MRRSVITVLITCLLGITSVASATAQSGASDPPPPGPPYPEQVEGTAVYDHAGFLSEGTIAELEASIEAIRERSGAEVVVYSQVKPESDTAEEAEADAAALHEQWGVGRWGADDGLIVFFDMQADGCHGQVQLYAGSGFDTAYMSHDARLAVFDEMLPALSECDMDAAALTAMEHIGAATSFESTPIEDLFPTAIATPGFSGIAPLVVRGQQDIEDYLLFDDPSPTDVVGLNEVAWRTGHALDDMTQVWGGFSSDDSERQFELTGWQIPGVDTFAFADSFRMWALERMGDPAYAEVELAGRLLTAFDTGSLLGSPNYMYAHDDTVWMFASPEEYAEDIAAALPSAVTPAKRPPDETAGSGARMEMADLGFAWTLPEGWIAFDIGGDLDAQVDAAIAAFGDIRDADATELLIRLVDLRGQYDLVAMDVASIAAGDTEAVATCNVSAASSLEDYTIDELVPAVADEFAAMEGVDVVRGPEPVALSAGPAFVIGISQPGSDGSGAVPTTIYFVAREDEFRTIDCLAPTAAADDWLSVVETWEWLSPESGQASAEVDASAISTGGRTEVPEQGYSLVAPADWISVHPTGGDADWIIETLQDIDPDLASSVESALEAGTDFSLLTFGALDADTRFRENCNVIDYPSQGQSVTSVVTQDAAAVEDLERLASGPETTFLEIAGGDVGRLDYGMAFPQFQTEHAAYYFVDGATVHLLTCTGVVRPEDDWASIAETWEWLADPAT